MGEQRGDGVCAEGAGTGVDGGAVHADGDEPVGQAHDPPQPGGGLVGAAQPVGVGLPGEDPGEQHLLGVVGVGDAGRGAGEPVGVAPVGPVGPLRRRPRVVHGQQHLQRAAVAQVLGQFDPAVLGHRHDPGRPPRRPVRVEGGVDSGQAGEVRQDDGAVLLVRPGGQAARADHGDVQDPVPVGGDDPQVPVDGGGVADLGDRVADGGTAPVGGGFDPLHRLLAGEHGQRPGQLPALLALGEAQQQVADLGHGLGGQPQRLGPPLGAGVAGAQYGQVRRADGDGQFGGGGAQ
ncbi:MAG UNVERIFIED_CONTAM: hypothetical protein LOD86_10530, partial [Thermobifida fusca]